MPLPALHSLSSPQENHLLDHPSDRSPLLRKGVTRPRVGSVVPIGFGSTHVDRLTLERASSSTNAAYSTPLLFAYAFSAMIAFSFIIVVPTSTAMSTHLFENAKLSGFVVASFSFGAAALQPVQAWIFAHVSLRVTYFLFIALFLTGSVLIILSLPVDSAVLFMVGRTVAGFPAGNQLFSNVLEREVYDSTQRMTAVRINTAALQFGMSAAFYVATIILYFGVSPSGAPLVFSNAATGTVVNVNAATVPYFVNCAIGVLMLLLAACAFHPDDADGNDLQPPASSSSLTEALIALAGLPVATATMSLKLVTLFVLEHRQWHYGIVGASLLASLIELGGLLSVILDPYILRRPELTNFSRWISAALMLGVAQWEGLSNTTSMLVYSLSAVTLTATTRILFVTASSTVYRYAQRSAHPIRWVMATGVMFELGMGVGSVLATVIEGPAGAVALAGGLLLYVIVSSV